MATLSAPSNVITVQVPALLSAGSNTLLVLTPSLPGASPSSVGRRGTGGGRVTAAAKVGG